MPNNDYANEPNQSRSEDIIQSILDNTEYDEAARSRIEYLLIELKNAIEGGGGGGGVTGSDKIVIVADADLLGSAIMTTSTATGVFERELTQDYSGLYYAIRIAKGTVCDNLNFKPMLCEKSVYEAINGEFQPYAMSNAEITAWILAHS